MKQTILVIGLGSMGQRRIRILKSLYPKCRVIGIDSSAKRAEYTKNEYGIEIYSGVEKVQIPIYAAFVCTSPESHPELIHTFLKKGCHVFSEINLIDTEYEKNMELAETQKKTLFLSSTPLYKEEIQYIIRRLQENKDKKIYSYHVGQYLADWHPWDKLEDFFASRKETNGCRELLAIELPWMTAAFGQIVNTTVTKGNFTHLGLSFPDTYMIQATHADGTVGNIIIDVVSPKAVRRFEVYNDGMYISWEGTPDSLMEKDVKSGKEHWVALGSYIHDKRYGSFINEAAYIKEVEEFFSVVDGKKAVYGFAQDQEIIHLINTIEG